jgi:hypothetical protein
MFTLIRILIGGTVQCLTGTMNVLRACIDILGAVDTLLSEFGSVQKGSLLDTIEIDVDRVKRPGNFSAMLDQMKRLICHAYTFNGMGITYTMAREVLDIKDKFDQYQGRRKDNLSHCYDLYLKRGCIMDDANKEDIDLENTFKRLARIRCKDVTELVVKRTYDHPVFGIRHGSVSLTEMILDANITLPDIRGMLACKFLSSIKTQ